MKIDGPLARAVHGRLATYSEQGWEVEEWLVLQEDEVPGHAGMHQLFPGDHVVVRDQDDRVVFDGALPQWKERYAFIFFRVTPKLPSGFFSWFATGYRATLLRSDR